jgi:hypothetical protein
MSHHLRPAPIVSPRRPSTEDACRDFTVERLEQNKDARARTRAHPEICEANLAARPAGNNPPMQDYETATRDEIPARTRFGRGRHASTGAA